MWGHSAVGKVIYSVIGERHPNLVCAVPASGSLGFKYWNYFYGGVPQRHYWEGLRNVGFGTFVEEILEQHPAYDWIYDLLDGLFDRSQVDIPLLFITGWYDTHPDLKIGTFSELRTEGKQFFNDMKLIVGPWHHVAFDELVQGELEFPEAVDYARQKELQFFDYYLRGQMDNGWDQEPTIRYFQMGSNTWKSASEWPPEVQTTYYYLQQGKRLVETAPGDTADPDLFIYNPFDPVPTTGGSSLIELIRIGTPIPPGHPTLDVRAGPYDLRQTIERHSVVQSR